MGLFFESGIHSLKRKLEKDRMLSESEADALLDLIVSEQDGIPTPEQQDALARAGYGETLIPPTIH